MQQSANPLFWSFSLGRIFSTRILVSYLLPVLLIGMLLKFGWAEGVTISCVLFCSILAHELFGHVLACRLTGGYGDEVLLWPLGGLAFVQPEPNFFSRFMTAAGGPLVNAILCLATLPTVYFSGSLYERLTPLMIPSLETSASLLEYVLLMIFSINWTLLLINLLPVFPLDGGLMMEAFLIDHTDPKSARQTAVRVGLAVGIVLSLVGWFFDETFIVTLATLLLLMNVWEHFRLQMPDSYEDSFMGYDFSQGYTSLEKSYHAPTISKKSWLQQRREKTAEKKKQKHIQEQKAMQERVDLLLEKVSRSGMDSLTASEKKELLKASTVLRKENHRAK
jgi:stage IV sporulation protein FB